MALRQEDIRLDLASEADLTSRASRGETAAFDELYRRHVDAAWRLALAVTRNPDDAADVVADAFAKVFTVMRAGRYNSESPFRGYLLVTTRNTAIDIFRRRQRESVSDSGDVIDLVDPGPGPAGWIESGAEASLVGAAFVGLPERWRSILWLTEVEGLAPRDAAPIIGLSPNATAQLAVRARRGLRERYARAHLLPADDLACRRAVDRLTGFSTGTLSAGDHAKVRSHLDGCAECSERLAELDEVNSRLKLFALPVPLLLLDRARLSWISSVEALTTSADGVAMAGEKAVAVGSIAAAAAGIVAATFFGSQPATDETALDRPDRGRPIAPVTEPIDATAAPVDLSWTEPVVIIRPDAVVTGAEISITTASRTTTVSPNSFDDRSQPPEPTGPAHTDTPSPRPAPVAEQPVPRTEVDDTLVAEAPVTISIDPQKGSAAVTVGPVAIEVAPELPTKPAATPPVAVEPAPAAAGVPTAPTGVLPIG